MFRWERRLKDLAQLLNQCESTYFDPELFRMNTNQFLQTSRTVTFLIQKTKSEIPNYGEWYKKHIIEAWSGDVVMTWAKDSRNTIEKEGDLDMYSTLSVTLIYSYLSHQDLSVPCGRSELLGANVRKLKKIARKCLPDAISDSAVVKTERTWVANTLPKWELLQAFKYIYTRLYNCCSDLACHLSESLSAEIRRPADHNSDNSNPRETIYFKLNSNDSISVGHKKIVADKHAFTGSPLHELFQSSSRPSDFEGLVELHANFAKAVFEKDGYHEPMCFFFGALMQPIDMLTTYFERQAEKFIFWRTVADKVAYLKPEYILWTAEGWLRNGQAFGRLPIRDLPVSGEFLEVVGLDKNGSVKRVTRMIRRDAITNQVKLDDQPPEFEYAQGVPNFLRPAFDALQLAHYQAV